MPSKNKIQGITMKNLISIFAILSLLISMLAFGRDDSLSRRINPRFYKKRNSAVLNVPMIYDESYYTEADLERVQKLLEKRFELATSSMIKMNTIVRAIDRQLPSI